MLSSDHQTARLIGAAPFSTASLQATIDHICASLCHDVSGPLNTLLGALECAVDARGESDTPDEALDLANEAAHSLVARLRLLRAAWSGLEGDLAPAALLDLLDGLANRQRLHIDVSALRPVALPAAVGRVLLNVLMLAAEALPSGGTIIVRQADDADLAIITQIRGVRAAWPADLAACLSHTAGIAPRLAQERRLQAPLTVLIASDAAVQLCLLMGSDDEPAPLLLSKVE